MTDVCADLLAQLEDAKKANDALLLGRILATERELRLKARIAELEKQCALK